MASNSKNEIRRTAKSTNQAIRITLSQINADHEKRFCHRLQDSLKPESLQLLAENIVSEGQQTPFTVFDSGQKDRRGQAIYILIGGFRRFGALQSSIQKNLDIAHIHPQMEVEAIEVVRGEGQSEEEFEKDLLIRSVGENEQRKNFSTEEKLAIVAEFQAKKIPTPRAASALSISETQYSRFVSVVSQPWLHELVVTNAIGMSDAAVLIDQARKKDWLKEFQADLEKWVQKHKEFIEAERKELLKIGKTLSGSAACVKKFINPKLVQHWHQLIGQRQRFGGKPEFQFGILFDKEKGTITVPGRTFKATELASDDYETMIGELEDAVENLLPLLKERRIIEDARNVTDEEKQQELARIRSLRKSKKAEQEQKLRGQEASDFSQSETPELTEVDTTDEEVDADELTKE